MRLINRTGRPVAVRVEQPGVMIVRMDLPAPGEWELPPSDALPPLDPAAMGVDPEEAELLARSRKRVCVMVCFTNDDFADGHGIELRTAGPETRLVDVDDEEDRVVAGTPPSSVCGTASCSSIAVWRHDWPAQPGLACDVCKRRLQELARVMGFELSCTRLG